MRGLNSITVSLPLAASKKNSMLNRPWLKPMAARKRRAT
jgi:hypothetical protein